jgi:glycosyltransferase involved in cell wall biosynthesis
MPHSVCIATYNGEPYVARQLSSILAQLEDEDEVVIVDDCSTDGTVEVIRQFVDPRVTLHINGRNQSVVRSFERAISMARHDVVFLADQDDVWLPGRVALMSRRLQESGALVVASNFESMDTNETPIDEPYDGIASRDSRRHLGNILDIFLGRTNYYGCAMAFHRSLIPVLLPIPPFVESHDLWLALAGNVARSIVHVDESTLRKRKHGGNVTGTVSTRPLRRRVWSRFVFLRSIAALFHRLRTTRVRA